jgi:uncharacterized membrane protein YfcA
MGKAGTPSNDGIVAMQSLLVLLIVGFFAQLIDGALGMAYGVTSTTLLLTTGLAPAVASATVHLAEVGTTLASGVSHWRFGNVNWRVVRRMGVPGAIGAFAGAVLLSSISTESARPWMAVILLTLGTYILLRFSFGGEIRRRGRSYVRGRYLAPLGLVAGFIDATGGGGWGPVATPTLLITGKIEPRKVIGSVDTSEFVVALGASVGFLLALGRQGVSLAQVGMLLAGGLIAAPIAAWLVHKVAPRLLGATVGGFIILTNVRTLLNQFEVVEAGRTLTYLVLCALWGTAVAWAVRQHRLARTRAAMAAGAPDEPVPTPVG